MASGKYPPAFPLRHAKKDLGLAEDLAKQTDQPLVVAKSVHKLYGQVQPFIDVLMHSCVQDLSE